MDSQEFVKIENFMKKQMKDAAHDVQHIYRVLYQSLNIAKSYQHIEGDVLIAASLLHDIGRDLQFSNPQLCHAREGGSMAYSFLQNLGWTKERAMHVKNCITTHRYRKSNPPETIEAKILFDSDKLDITGSLGLARTLIYKGQVNEPLYTMDHNNEVHLGSENDPESFIKEYHFKLKNVYDGFYTPEAKEIAETRKRITTSFYNELIEEISIVDLDVLLNQHCGVLTGD